MYSWQLRTWCAVLLAMALAAMAGCGSVYHNARLSLNPDPAARAAARSSAANEAEKAMLATAADLRVTLRAPHWREQREDASDLLLLRTFELERAALSVIDVPGADAAQAQRQAQLARTVRVAAQVCHEGPADSALAALDEALPERRSASVSK